MGNEKTYRRRVGEVRELVIGEHSVNWSTPRLMAVYGATPYTVKRRLVEINWCGRHITVHRKVADDLKRIEDRIRRKEKAKGYERWVPESVGTFAWRRMRGRRSLSHHSFGICLDIDEADNESTARFDKHDMTTIPVRVVQAFADEGWTWGGSWNGPCDPMHFQKA